MQTGGCISIRYPRAARGRVMPRRGDLGRGEIRDPRISNSAPLSLISGGNKVWKLNNTQTECKKNIYIYKITIFKDLKRRCDTDPLGLENTACLAERALFLSYSRVNRNLKQFHSLL